MMRNRGICGEYADFAHNLDISQLPPSVISRAKLAVLDYVSALCAGIRYGEISPIIRDYVESIAGAEQSSVIGLGKKCPAIMAALANGAISHSSELDDGHRFGTCHPAAVIIPAAMSLAEVVKCSGADFLAAVIVGYEIMLRIATAINPSHWWRGFHSTGTCGAVGASAAAAKILRLNETKAMYAISMGALQGAGLQEMIYSNSMIKPLQPGKAALAGVISAQLAQSNARSPSTVFEGQLGFFKAMTDEMDSDSLTDALGERFEINRTYFKFYPSCRHVHCCLDLVRKIQDENSFDAEAVESVEVRSYTIAVKEVGSTAYPRNTDEAMFSIPYALSVWLHENRLTHNELGTQYLTRPDIRETAQKVTVKVDEQWDAKYPDSRGATVLIQLRDGRVFEESRDLPYGEPENLGDDSRLIKKYEDCTNGLLSSKYAQNLLENILQMEQQKDVTFLAEVLRNADV